MKPMYFLYWESQCWTQLLVTLPVLSRGIISLDLMTTLILMQPRIHLTFISARVYCWLFLCLLTMRTPNAFSVELPSSSLAAVCTGAGGYSSYSRCRTFHFPCRISWAFYWPISPACPSPPGWQHDPLV